ncbi:hypothetical protein SKAU_G00337390 [Synaphobranchus kaupii]|uniref:Uncharacterized protein n=1 Tax=Synaphobranchus kaupii TaxID=118154 RepID=A0A9Q1EMD9_SYNKA|nr:hypothetical protein SKAU_G00337390 [Synaphobranchus kaupii]
MHQQALAWPSVPSPGVVSHEGNATVPRARPLRHTAQPGQEFTARMVQTGIVPYELQPVRPCNTSLSDRVTQGAASRVKEKNSPPSKQKRAVCKQLRACVRPAGGGEAHSRMF